MKSFFQSGQRGFTLIELMAALLLTGMVSTGLAMSITQMVELHGQSAAHMTAVKEVENASYWLELDARMAQQIVIDNTNGFPLSLTWRDWMGDTHNILYSIDDTRLLREANGAVQVIAVHINPDILNTNCTYQDKVLQITITSTVPSKSSAASETRICHIVPRPGL